MTMGVQVFVRLSGGHSLRPGDVEAACEDAKRALSGRCATYSIMSSVKDHELHEKGGTGGSESAQVKIKPSSFSVHWEAGPLFQVPDAMLAVVDGCLRITGKVDVMASVLLNNVQITPPKIGDGSLVRRLSVVTVDLEPPGEAKKAPDADEFKFTGLAMPSGADTGNFVIFGSHKSTASGVRRALERILLALSDYREVYQR